MVCHSSPDPLLLYAIMASLSLDWYPILGLSLESRSSDILELLVLVSMSLMDQEEPSWEAYLRSEPES